MWHTYMNQLCCARLPGAKRPGRTVLTIIYSGAGYHPPQVCQQSPLSADSFLLATVLCSSHPCVMLCLLPCCCVPSQRRRRRLARLPADFLQTSCRLPADFLTFSLFSLLPAGCSGYRFGTNNNGSSKHTKEQQLEQCSNTRNGLQSLFLGMCLETCSTTVPGTCLPGMCGHMLWHMPKHSLTCTCNQ